MAELKRSAEMSSSDIAAWWGAILATVVFAWELIKWFKTAPVLVIRVQMLESRIDGVYGKFFALEVANVGNQTTTLSSVSAKAMCQTIEATRVEFGGDSLPKKMEPSDIWRGRFSLEVISTGTHGHSFSHVQIRAKDSYGRATFILQEVPDLWKQPRKEA